MNTSEEIWILFDAIHEINNDRECIRLIDKGLGKQEEKLRYLIKVLETKKIEELSKLDENMEKS